jgi:hypothetical protein
MTNWMMRGSRPRGYKKPEWRLGQRREQTGPGMGWAGRPGTIQAQLGVLCVVSVPESS